MLLKDARGVRQRQATESSEFAICEEFLEYPSDCEISQEGLRSVHLVS
jgi:hypothetical protein